MASTTAEVSEEPEQQRVPPRLVNGAVEVPAGMSKREFKRKLKAEKRHDEHEDWVAARREKRKLLKKRKRNRVQEAAISAPSHIVHEHSGVSVVLDCSFDDYMKDGEITSLARQITRCYSENRKCACQVNMHVSSMNKRLLETFDENQHGQFRSWKPNFSFSQTDFEGTDKTVYLSSDSETVLETLHPGWTYVIGGLVDKGRHKNLCRNKAEASGVKTARLPIDEHIKVSGRRVLATNHVFELILKYLELRDWKAAFQAILPERKLTADKEPLGS